MSTTLLFYSLLFERFILFPIGRTSFFAAMRRTISVLTVEMPGAPSNSSPPNTVTGFPYASIGIVVVALSTDQLLVSDP